MEQVWAAGKARAICGKYPDGSRLYRVGYTLFVDHIPAESVVIEFRAKRPGLALNEIHSSGKSPVEFHGHTFRQVST